MLELWTNARKAVPALERDGPEDLVEGRLPVRGDHDASAIRQVVGIPNLAALKVRQLGKMGIGQDAGQGLAVFVVEGHGAAV